MPVVHEDALLTFEQARARINMSERFVRAEVANGNLAAHRFGKVLRFDPETVAAYIEAHRVAPTAQPRRARRVRTTA